MKSLKESSFWAEGKGVKIAPGGPAQCLPMRSETCSEHSRRKWKILLNQDCSYGLKMIKMAQKVKIRCPLPSVMIDRLSVDQWRAGLGHAFASSEPLPAQPLLKAIQKLCVLPSFLHCGTVDFSTKNPVFSSLSLRSSTMKQEGAVSSVILGTWVAACVPFIPTGSIYVGLCLGNVLNMWQKSPVETLNPLQLFTKARSETSCFVSFYH